MRMRIGIRFGRGFVPPLSSTTLQVGVAERPLLVLYTFPSFCATQMMSEFPGGTAIAFNWSDPGARIAAHVAAVRTSLFTQSEAPPASMRFGSLGSRMNGATKFAPFVSGGAISVEAKRQWSVERRISKYIYSP